MKKLYEQRKTLRNVIGEIYLLKDGETLEIIYQGKLWVKQLFTHVSKAFSLEKNKAGRHSKLLLHPIIKIPRKRRTNSAIKRRFIPRGLSF